jgi:beta-1,2-mannobiose phosphorylase / 1,2-beta-oligomannan phosphorylase
MELPDDWIIFSPGDVDLSKSPLRSGIGRETYVLGAFNPGMARLPNGNILLMARIAEALSEPVKDGHIRSIRWEGGAYVLDHYNLDDVETDDPRKFILKRFRPNIVYALTSLSWLLPVELTPDGRNIVEVHYDKIVAPDRSSQEYGIEDARITRIGDKYYMTTCTVSSERHATTLFESDNGLDFRFRGIILDHQNKDMLIFNGKVGDEYFALTRPLGSLYFVTGKSSPWLPGPSISLATSPDLLYWKPFDQAFIRARKGSGFGNRIGGGTPPVLTEKGWLMLYHGVEDKGHVGIYRTYWAMLDKSEPWKIIRHEDSTPLLEAMDNLTANMKDKIYLEDVVFTTGILDFNDHFIVASGELDLACRLSLVPKKIFGLK